MKVLEGLQISTDSPLPRSNYDDTLSQDLKDGAVEVKLPPELPQ